MPRDPEAYLFDIKDACAFLSNFISSRSLDDLRQDRGFRSAVERELLIIGEAMFQLQKLSPDIFARISESERIVRFRHILVHGYDIVDPDIVWTVVADKLPILAHEVSQLLPGEPPSRI